MTESSSDLAALLTRLLHRLCDEPRRYYGGTWDDWAGGTTGVSEPVVYCLWRDAQTDRPDYVGKTVNLGRRLAAHWAAEGWDPLPSHVSHVDHPRFHDPSIRTLFERFVIATLQPTQNSHGR